MPNNNVLTDKRIREINQRGCDNAIESGEPWGIIGLARAVEREVLATPPQPVADDAAVPTVGNVTGLYQGAQTMSKAAWVKAAEGVLNAVLAHAWESTRGSDAAVRGDERAD